MKYVDSQLLGLAAESGKQAMPRCVGRFGGPRLAPKARLLGTEAAAAGRSKKKAPDIAAPASAVNASARARFPKLITKKGRQAGRPLVSKSMDFGLFELRRYAGEGGIELGAEPVHDRDDGNRNAGGDQAVFNRGRCRLILRKPNKKLKHDAGPWGLPSASGPQTSRAFLSVRKFTECKCAAECPRNYDKCRGIRTAAAGRGQPWPRPRGSPAAVASAKAYNDKDEAGPEARLFG
jgi:hypothetical protein